MKDTDAGAFGDRLDPLGRAEHAPGVHPHQLLEAELGQRLLRRGAAMPRGGGRTESLPVVRTILS
jgi:hypothetical protein